MMNSVKAAASGERRGQFGKGPARPHRESERLMLAGGEALMTGVGDHRAVVGAKFQARIIHADTALRRQRRKPRAQSAVGADAARHHQPHEAGVVECAPAYAGKGVGHSVLEGAGDVGAGLVVGADVLLSGEGMSLENAEPEIETGPIKRGPRKVKTRGVAALGELRQRRAAGVA